MNPKPRNTSIFWADLEEVCGRLDVLKHPFYVRWSMGHLTLRELSVYAAEYRHAVRALAVLVLSAARRSQEPERSKLYAHGAQEVGHIDIWNKFASALPPIEPGSSPTAETLACVDAWTDPPRSSLLHSLVAIYTIESGQAEVAAAKRATLPLYGLDGPECAYFDVHSELDREHASSVRSLIEPRLGEVDWEPLLTQAESVLVANWKLLDGVERRNGMFALDQEDGKLGDNGSLARFN